MARVQVTVSDEDPHRPEYFLGLTKVQFIMVIAILALVTSASFGLAFAYNAQVSRSRISENTAAIRLLCDRGVIIDGLVQSSAGFFTARIANETGQAKIDHVAIREKFRAYHRELVREQMSEDSPCR